LAEHLRNLGKNVSILNSDGVPRAFRFLDPDGFAKQYSQAKHASIIKKTEVIFVLDASGNWERTGRIGEVLAQTEATKICIDHHPDSTDFVDVAVVDTDTAATAELIYQLVMAMEGAVSASMAQALYAGIITDTGNFRFPKTSPQTHQITAALLAAGAHPLEIYRQIYEQYSLERVRLKGHVIDSIQTTTGGQIAYYSLSRATLKDYRVDVSELDGFASLGQQIGGVRVVIFGVELSRGRVKISLRSDGSVPINHLAAGYGGGGHASAAGAIIEGELALVIAEVLEKVKAVIAAA
jgi:bifunctional oligoribonuclease and PAP phosphatase NrnA